MRKPRSKRSRRREAPSAKARAVEFLSRREHGAQELKRKLIAKGVDADEAVQAVDALAADGWQSDLRYAQAVTRARASQGYGPRRITYELSQAGVDDAVVREALAAEAFDWLAIAHDWYQRKYETEPEDAAERVRRRRKLFGRGFDEATVRAAMGGVDDEDRL